MSYNEYCTLVELICLQDLLHKAFADQPSQPAQEWNCDSEAEVLSDADGDQDEPEDEGRQATECGQNGDASPRPHKRRRLEQPSNFTQAIFPEILAAMASNSNAAVEEEMPAEVKKASSKLRDIVFVFESPTHYILVVNSVADSAINFTVQPAQVLVKVELDALSPTAIKKIVGQALISNKLRDANPDLEFGSLSNRIITIPVTLEKRVEKSSCLRLTKEGDTMTAMIVRKEAEDEAEC